MATPVGSTSFAPGGLPFRAPGGGLSPHHTQHFAADPLLAGLAVAHHALRRAQDGDAEAVEHLLQLLGPLVVPAAGPARPADRPDHFLAVRTVLQVDPQDAPRLTGFRPLLELC